MNLTEIKLNDWERVAHITDEASGLNAFIAVHDSSVGKVPGAVGVSLGGIRMRAYDEPEAEVTLAKLSAEERAQFDNLTAPERRGLEDVVRLSRGMSYKSAVADTRLGGGKSVIVANPEDYPLGSEKRETLMKAMGRAIQMFAEKYPESIYVGAEDMNTKPADMLTIEGETQHISGTGHDKFKGNPSPFTAIGTEAALRTAMKDELDAQGTFKGKKIAISGVGSVGGALAEALHAEGAQLVITDKNPEAAKALQAKLGSNVTIVGLDEIHKQEVDAYVPAAIGGVLNDATIPGIKAKYIVPVANNVLAEPRHGQVLHDKGIIYVPDYVANAGGIIAVGMEVEHKRDGKPLKMDEIADTVTRKITQATQRVLDMSKDLGIPTSDAADKVGDEIMTAARRQVGHQAVKDWVARSSANKKAAGQGWVQGS